ESLALRYEMPRNGFAFTKNRQRRFTRLVYSRIVVVAKRPLPSLLFQHEIKHVCVTIGEYVANFVGGNPTIEAGFFHHGKSLLEQKHFGQKITGSRTRVFESKDFAPQIVEPHDTAFFAGENQASIFRKSTFPTPDQ